MNSGRESWHALWRSACVTLAWILNWTNQEESTPILQVQHAKFKISLYALKTCWTFFGLFAHNWTEFPVATCKTSSIFPFFSGRPPKQLGASRGGGASTATSRGTVGVSVLSRKLWGTRVKLKVQWFRYV